MLRTYGPSCDGSLIEATSAKIPDTATWVDLEEPTKEEEALVERCIRMDVPTESEMAEIEPSSRLYEREGALYMTVSVLYGVQDGDPRTTPISFVLTDNRLVTVRYATPKPLRAFAEHARRDPSLVKDAPTALVRMLDAPNVEGDSFNLVADPCLNAREYISELERAAKVKFTVIVCTPVGLIVTSSPAPGMVPGVPPL